MYPLANPGNPSLCVSLSSVTLFRNVCMSGLGVRGVRGWLPKPFLSFSLSDYPTEQLVGLEQAVVEETEGPLTHRPWEFCGTHGRRKYHLHFCCVTCT